MIEITDTFQDYRREQGKALTSQLEEAHRISDERERERAITQARDDYASGRLKLGYPDVLTKRYRLLWDEKGQLYGDPEEPHEMGSTTAGGPRYAFEADDLKEVREKVKELKLTFTYGEGEAAR